MQSIKKLSIAKCAGKMTLKRILEGGGKLAVLRVVGMALGVKQGESDYGAWTALIGDFGVTNLIDGEQFRGATLFLPDVALLPIQVQLQKPGAQAVQFALDVYACEDETSSVGYSYTVDHLVKTEDDMVAKLMKAAHDARPLQLTAPKVEPIDKAKKEAAGKAKAKAA